MVYFMGSFNNKVDYQFLKNTGTDDLLKTKKKRQLNIYYESNKYIYIKSFLFKKKKKSLKYSSYQLTLKAYYVLLHSKLKVNFYTA